MTPQRPAQPPADDGREGAALVEDLRVRDHAAWDALYEPDSAAPIWHPLPFLSDHLERWKTAGVHSILDAACGDCGQMTAIPDHLLSVGVDQSAAAVRNGTRHLRARGRHNFILIKSQIEAMPFPDACFDAILFVDVLLCLPDPQPALREFHRVLRPGGAFLTTTFQLTPHLNAELQPIPSAPGLYLFEERYINRFFSTSQLTSMYSAAGFAVELLSVRTDPEAPHPGYRDEVHSHERIILESRRR